MDNEHDTDTYNPHITILEHMDNWMIDFTLFAIAVLTYVQQDTIKMENYMTPVANFLNKMTRWM